MKILSPTQIKALDLYTIENEPISSIDLMERAALTFVYWFEKKFPAATYPHVQVVCGTGNNGGDGLAIARLLNQRFYRIELFLCAVSPNVSDDFATNQLRLSESNDIPIYILKKDDPLPDFSGHILIDSIFGSGLNRPITDYWAQLIQHINTSNLLRVSVDIPSGLFAHQPTTSIAVQAEETFSFQLPKLAFLFPENFSVVKNWTIGNIQLSPIGLASLVTKNYYITATLANSILQTRSKFGHKGTYGHALLIAGSHGKMGAAILAAKASLRAGCGLLSVHIPRCGYEIMQIAFPEAMTQVDRHKRIFSRPPKLTRYQAIGVGPGLGTNKITVEAMEELLDTTPVPLVIDADALNILGKHPELLKKIPSNSILTPHPKEFQRLFGVTENDFARNELQRQKAQELQNIIVLKGAHTCIALPDGNCYFNSTGNPGMGTAGTGDVLTGILLGLLAQGYSAQQAAILGVYLHGLAGDIAQEVLEQESLLASDLIGHLGKAYKKLRKKMV